jgi:nucleotide-binding universal stress UspA family protein
MKDLHDDRTIREAIRTVGSPNRGPTRYGRAVAGYVSALTYPDAAVRPVLARPAVSRPGRRPVHDAVVVGVDDSPASTMALDHAVIEADLRGWDVWLVHAQHGGLHAADRDAGGALLARLIDRVHALSPTVAATSRLYVGAPGPTLVRESATAGLLTVGCPPSRVMAALGGAVTEYVTAHRHGPVLVVRVPGWPHGQDLAAHPVVVGVDGSAGSAAAVDFAAQEALLRGCDLVLLHAIGDPAAPPSDDPLDAVDVFPTGLTVHRRRVEGTAARILVVASTTASAVVVGSRGRGAVAAALLGSVTRSLIHRAHCPVFVVH